MVNMAAILLLYSALVSPSKTQLDCRKNITRQYIKFTVIRCYGERDDDDDDGCFTATFVHMIG